MIHFVDFPAGTGRRPIRAFWLFFWGQMSNAQERCFWGQAGQNSSKTTHREFSNLGGSWGTFIRHSTSPKRAKIPQNWPKGQFWRTKYALYGHISWIRLEFREIQDRIRLEFRRFRDFKVEICLTRTHFVARKFRLEICPCRAYFEPKNLTLVKFSGFRKIEIKFQFFEIWLNSKVEQSWWNWTKLGVFRRNWFYPLIFYFHEWGKNEIFGRAQIGYLKEGPGSGRGLANFTTCSFWSPRIRVWS